MCPLNHFASLHYITSHHSLGLNPRGHAGHPPPSLSSQQQQRRLVVLLFATKNENNPQEQFSIPKGALVDQNNDISSFITYFFPQVWPNPKEIVSAFFLQFSFHRPVEVLKVDGERRWKTRGGSYSLFLFCVFFSNKKNEVIGLEWDPCS